uniref:Uncharacterized protein n=1 Tax=Cannabis sativa TaxID=3483 RepID=A0A803PB35_CANSA
MSYTVDEQLLPAHYLRGNGQCNICPQTNIPNQSTTNNIQIRRPPSISVFNRLGSVHDLRDDLNRRKGQDRQFIPPNAQPMNVNNYVPGNVLGCPQVTQVSPQARQVYLVMQARIDKLKSLLQSLISPKLTDLEIDRLGDTPFH